MKPDGNGSLHPRWAAARESREGASSYHYLLDLDVDLAEALDVRMRLVARPAATAFTFEADVGEIGLSPRLAAAEPADDHHAHMHQVGRSPAALGPACCASRPG